MSEQGDMRPGEVAVELPASYDAGVYFIGRIRTPFKTRAECPKSPAASDAIGRVELDERYAAGLADLALYSHAFLLYWMDQARRDLLQQVPAHLGRPRGTFALQVAGAAQPHRPGRGGADRHRGHDADRAQGRLHRRHAAHRHQALFRLRRQLSERQAALSPAPAVGCRAVARQPSRGGPGAPRRPGPPPPDARSFLGHGLSLLSRPAQRPSGGVWHSSGVHNLTARGQAATGRSPRWRPTRRRWRRPSCAAWSTRRRSASRPPTSWTRPAG